jgi:hypothetical protein
LSLANLRPTAFQSQQAPPLPTFAFTRQPPSSPRSPKDARNIASPAVPVSPMRRRGSQAYLPHVEATGYVDPQQTSQIHTQGLLAPSFIPIRTSSSQGGIASSSVAPPPSSPSTRTIPRRSSYVQLSQPPLRMRSGTIAGISSKPFPAMTSQSNQKQTQDRNDRKTGDDHHLKQHLHLLPSDEQRVDYVPEFGSGNVLSTATRFEKGEFCG